MTKLEWIHSNNSIIMKYRCEAKIRGVNDSWKSCHRLQRSKNQCQKSNIIFSHRNQKIKVLSHGLQSQASIAKRSGKQKNIQICKFTEEIWEISTSIITSRWLWRVKETVTLKPILTHPILKNGNCLWQYSKEHNK